MERSQLLGHCICDVRRPCPCDVLREQNICPCAGERPDPIDLSQVKLTEWVRNAGCASKIPPAELDAVLGRLPPVQDPAVISGLAAADDAAIYRISDDLCLVQTVDVFTPCVDDPHLFGRICAVNCLSDIYAMGGEPRTALSILAFPTEKLPGEVMFHLLAGAMEVFAEGGVALVGGHSIKDDEIKLGFAITGLINPSVAAALDKPSPDDVLVLTKPLGTGVLTFGQQIGRGHAEGLTAAQASMATLNKAAALAMREAGASACTDVTGFGLFAHLLRMLRQSHCSAEIIADAQPAFPGAVEALRQGVIPGAIERNREYVGDSITAAADVDPALIHLGFDAQTSGGLLIAIAPKNLANLQLILARSNVPCFVIGRIIDRADHRIFVNAAALSKNANNGQPETVAMNEPSPTANSHHDCCADVFSKEPAQSSVAESQKAFAALIQSVQSPGVLDAKTKELLLFTLVVHSRCQPCFEVHYRKALALGLTQTELDEAAWCAIALGGAAVKMFYQENVERAQKG